MCDVKAEVMCGSCLMFKGIPILHKAVRAANRIEL
jgi:hypothetical protein